MSDDLDTMVLRRVLAYAMRPPAASVWEAPEPAFVAAAAASYLLLDRDPPYDAEHFVLETLEPLLHEASRSTARNLVRDARAVRGRVLWGATIAARAAAAQGETPYVYQEVRRQYDTPENQLLRLLIESLFQALSLLPAALRNGACYMPAAETAWLPAAPRLRRLEETLRRARVSPRLRHVSLPARVAPAMLLRAETSRNEGYALAARLYRRYRALQAPRTWRAACAATARRVLPLPATADSESDVWIDLAAHALRAPAV